MRVDNPIGKAIVLNVANSNSRNFSVSPSVISVGPYGSANVNIKYTPSSISEVETAEITLSHPEVGEYTYRCRGSGSRPTTMTQIVATAGVGRTTSQIASFKNPFPSPYVFTTYLETDGPDKVFELLLRKHRVTLNPFVMLQIPFAFHPVRMTDYRATLVVETMGT